MSYMTSMTSYFPYTPAKNYENWSAVDKVIAITKGVSIFMAHSVYS